MLSMGGGITHLDTSVASWWQINWPNETVMKHVAIDFLPSSLLRAITLSLLC